MPSQKEPAECANPLLLSFVGEWLREAKERNTKAASTYNRAYKSLKECPIQFNHPCELKQLTGFGDVMCKRLTQKLEEYCKENDEEMPKQPRGNKRVVVPENEDNDAAPPPPKKTRKQKPYVPSPRTGPHALLLALGTLAEDAPQGLTKPETIEIAQDLCDSSFTAAEPGKFYTAWKSMDTLVNKDLVQEKGRPTKRYRLTDEGWTVYKRMKAVIEGNPPPQTQTFENEGKNKVTDEEQDSSGDDSFVEIGSVSMRSRDREDRKEVKKGDNEFADVVPQGHDITDELTIPTFSPITIQPWAFSVEFVLDIREIRAKSDRSYMQDELIKKGIKPIMKNLDIGDGLWVAKCKDPQLLSRLGLEGDEIMLDWVMERKRLDDLVSSIKDRRFHEQKFRLKRSKVKNVVYIIEEITISEESKDRYGEAIESAIASMQVVDEFFVKKTQKMDDTIRYLARMTKLLKNIYENKPLQIIPTKHLTAKNYEPILKSLSVKQPEQDFHISYEAFASLASKSDAMTLRDYYLKMLMCTRGITGEKALEIQKIWKTPIDFIEAFEKCGHDGDASNKRKRELVSSATSMLLGRKKIAGAVSARIAENWAAVPPLK